MSVAVAEVVVEGMGGASSKVIANPILIKVSSMIRGGRSGTLHIMISTDPDLLELPQVVKPITPEEGDRLT